MKRVICNILIIIMVSFFFSGCASSNSAYPADARGVVSAFCKELAEGDFGGALAYCEKDSDAYQRIEQRTEDNLLHELAIDLSEDEEEQKRIEGNKYIQSWIHAYYEYLFKDFQIVDFEEKKDKTEFVVGISVIDVEIDSLLVHLVRSEISNDYYAENQEELDALMEEAGESAVIIRYLEDKGSDLTDAYMGELENNATYSSINYYAALKKTDDGWKITDFQSVDSMD